MAGRKETVTDEEIISLFRNSDDPVLTTAEVADELGFTLTGARKRLYSLEKVGNLSMKKAGNSPVWWIDEENE
ncbi:hypothetical protein GJ633_03005 [Halorubrum sp. CBA1125]|uniref:FaeA/PapI family transcriptional regulator n=1 Tax=Halorubrum sp. CBA1125 TaxID=2668072 RepID=UPI0012E7063A|nr:FaeA/PapI family transcriptional regulator [Halorubrum sp. CBA1125]MUW13740.1 hypothetical protein [Halorubrum sp. CBA1125]